MENRKSTISCFPCTNAEFYSLFGISAKKKKKSLLICSIDINTILKPTYEGSPYGV